MTDQSEVVEKHIPVSLTSWVLVTVGVMHVKSVFPVGILSLLCSV